MKFTNKPPILAPREEAIGRFAAAALSSSLLLLVAFLFLAFGTALQMWITVLLAAAIFALYIAQARYLSIIGRYSARRRLRIWQLSFGAHCAAFMAAFFVVHDPIVFVLLLPEGISALLHIWGILYAKRSLQSV